MRKFPEESERTGHATTLPLQHSTATGDACYGDAGGSVWKFWVFRENSDVPDNRIHKLAVLTGVVSR